MSYPDTFIFCSSQNFLLGALLEYARWKFRCYLGSVKGILSLLLRLFATCVGLLLLCLRLLITLENDISLLWVLMTSLPGTMQSFSTFLYPRWACLSNNRMIQLMKLPNEVQAEEGCREVADATSISQCCSVRDAAGKQERKTYWKRQR